jgi:hypothetical protein
LELYSNVSHSIDTWFKMPLDVLSLTIQLHNFDDLSTFWFGHIVCPLICFHHFVSQKESPLGAATQSAHPGKEVLYDINVFLVYI